MVSDAEDHSNTLTNGMYATLTEAASDETSNSEMKNTLEIWPNNVGEKGYHKFTMTNVLAEDLMPQNELWIFFNSQEYDYYIGESQITYPGDLDEDGFEVYYMPCLVQVDGEDFYSASSYCTTKRYTVRVYLGLPLSSKKEVVVTLVGIRNPDTTNTLTYTMAFMNYLSNSNYVSEYNQNNSALFFARVTNSFDPEPGAMLDLFSVDSKNPRSRALSDSDSY